MLHRLFTGLKRVFGSRSPEYVTEQKAYGNRAEVNVVRMIKEMIPECSVKKSVILKTKSSKGEIDCLLLYDNKLFIVEIKNWKGIIEERTDCFVSIKTYKLDTKEHRSPFKQVKRQIRLLKEMTNSNPWINPIVFFSATDKVNTISDEVYFTDIYELAKYITADGKKSNPQEIKKCLSSCREADYIYSSSFSGDRSLHCIISDSSLAFTIDGIVYSRKDIEEIIINHKFSHDDVTLCLRNNMHVTRSIENATIVVDDGGDAKSYSLCKLDRIILGN